MMTTETVTLPTMTVKRGAPEREDMENMDGWTVTLHYQGRRMTIPFYMGVGHNGAEPEMEDVLYALMSDAYLGELDFGEFCADLGYNFDSRKAERDWKACRRERSRVRRLLGDDFDAISELVTES